MINTLVKKIIEFNKNDKHEKIKILLEDELKNKPSNIELLLRLAIFELWCPDWSDEKSKILLERVFKVDRDNAVALLILAYIYEYYELSGISEQLMNRLNSLVLENPETSSMLKYVESWFYADKYDYINQEKLLQESINLYDGYVYNYVNLAKLYFLQGKKEKAKEYVIAALKNVKKVYSVNNQNYDPTDYNEFINEKIKGIHLTEENLKFIEELLDIPY
jgi:tetratricopeptide (TPR) repeat protein